MPLMNLADEFERLIDALEAAHARYAVAGGLALAVWGAPRATTDIDLLVLAEDVPELLALVAPLGFTLEALPMKFSDGVEVRRLTKIEAGDAITLDLLVGGEALEEVWQGRVRLPTERGHMSVVSREGLIRMKLSANRPQDIVDVERLRGMDR